MRVLSVGVLVAFAAVALVMVSFSGGEAQAQAAKVQAGKPRWDTAPSKHTSVAITTSEVWHTASKSGAYLSVQCDTQFRVRPQGFSGTGRLYAAAPDGTGYIQLTRSVSSIALVAVSGTGTCNVWEHAAVE